MIKSPAPAVPTPAIHAIEARIRHNMGRAMLAARWLVAPIYLGLLVVLGLLTVKFVQQLVITVPGVLGMTSNDLILTALALVDLSLVANLVVIVIFAGWANFVGPLLREAGERDTAWASNLDFSAVKLKLIASAAAIGAIQILESFVHISDVPKPDAAWQLAILLGIGVTGVLLAAMDRISHVRDSNGRDSNGRVSNAK
ncbi:MAG TPA: YqhA family protein [Acetobacteraceae bacterium]|jgi:uncharacterized protein (TIGR00645 family)|nr:YqhA family protein [Acetobacteraceae bacterium]